AEIVHNPNLWDRTLHRLRRTIIGWCDGAALSPSPQPKSDLSDFGQSKRPNSGKPEFGWGEGGARRSPGEGGRISREIRPPSPQPSPLRGEGVHLSTPRVRESDARPLTVLIAALGGEGGGVLTSWIVTAA